MQFGNEHSLITYSFQNFEKHKLFLGANSLDRHVLSVNFVFGYLQTFGLLNFLAENFIFSYIGLSVFTFGRHKWNVGFICWSFVSFLLHENE